MYQQQQQQQQHKQTVVADDNAIDNTTLFGSDVDDVDGGGGFGACMLIMDDNHFLIEWLAYHYHVLPLKALILAVDPASKTSPRDITNRYFDSSSSSSNDKKRMYIEVWDHEDYLKPYLEEYTTSKKFTSNETSDHVKNVQTYIWRQRVFFLECMKRFHALRGDDDNGKKVDNNNKTPTRLSKNITHIAFVDSDEFITINPSAAKEFNVAEHLSLSRSSSTTTAAAATTPQKEEKNGATAIGKTPTVWDILQAAKRKQAANETSLSKLPFYQRLTGGCVPMARLQYSTKETSSIRLQNSSNSFNSSSFLTLRYQHHFGLQNLKKNRKIKSILDMTQLSPFHFKLEFIHAHRTLKSKCKVDWEWIQPLQSPIVANHYVGSWDQWTFRDDPRSWTRKKVNKYQSMSGENDNNDNGGTTKVVFRQEMMAATTWLDEFVQEQGIETAQRLLKDVGYVPPRDTVLLHNDTNKSRRK